ncbi:MAG: AraC family transcriptional regulator [Elusimicrobia bacterium]|nr:AraC family transcriptional regulator [Elusimicrobiota bacterium]
MKFLKYTFPFPEKDYPFQITTQNIVHRTYHVHPFIIEFQYIRSGNGFFYIKDKRYATKDKSLFIIHEHDIHTYINEGKKAPDVNITLMVFSKYLFEDYPAIQPLLKSIINCHKNFPHQICFNEKEANDIELILYMLEQERKKKGENYHEIMTTLLITFLMLIKRNISNTKKNIISTEEHNHIIDVVLEYIDKHFKEHITLSNLSKHVGYSPYHISHLFKKFSGLSFKASIANRRVLEAKRILELDNNKKIIAIAYEVGFKNLGAFNWNFKRLTDITPSLYRKLYMSVQK